MRETISMAGAITKQFTVVVDDAISVSIISQEPVIRADPTGMFGKSIDIDIKNRIRVCKADQLNTVPVKIDDKWRVIALGRIVITAALTGTTWICTTCRVTYAIVRAVERSVSNAVTRNSTIGIDGRRHTGPVVEHG